MSNIFENAYFGKPYKTSDEKKAIYLRMFICNGYCHLLSTGNTEFAVDEQGKVNKNIYPCGVDIISEWQGPINDEELDKIALEKYPILSVIVEDGLKRIKVDPNRTKRECFKEGCKEILKGL